MQSPALASSTARRSLSLSVTGTVRRQAGVGGSAGDSAGMVMALALGPPAGLAVGGFGPGELLCGPLAAGGALATPAPPQPANSSANARSKRRQRRLRIFGFLVIGSNIPTRTRASERKTRG